MSVHLIAIFTLLVIFALGTLRPVNLGALALVATFAVGEIVAGEDAKTILSGFPPDLFVLLFGVTYLFGIASVNGTIEWLVNSLARLVGDRTALIPWVMFFVAAIPTTAGALGPAAVAMLAPIALPLAKKYDINLRLMGLMGLHGSCALKWGEPRPHRHPNRHHCRCRRRASLSGRSWNACHRLRGVAALVVSVDEQRSLEQSKLEHRVVDLRHCDLHGAATENRHHHDGWQ